MKSTKIAVALVILVGAFITVAHGQTTVFVPGNASGFFGNPVDQINPFVPALTASGPGTITVAYVSGSVNWGGGDVGPNGGPSGVNTNQFPLQEAKGVAPLSVRPGVIGSIGALIGVFVPQSRVNAPGFTAIDGTKGAAQVGIIPDGVLFIGTGKTFSVNQAGTLFLGINDTLVGDNSGGFTVTVSIQ